MAIVAYYGHPSSRLFGRVQFPSWEHARIAVWNDSALFGLHDTAETTTHWDRMWAAADPAARSAEPTGQLPLFEGWDVDPLSLGRAIDAAIAKATGQEGGAA